MMRTIQPGTVTQAGPNWSKLGLGTGTLASIGQAASVSEADRIVGTMLDLGMTVIDTADSYASGACEILLGKILRRKGQHFTLVTKAGYRLSNLRGPLRPLNPFIKKAIHRMGRRQLFDPIYLTKCLDHSLSRLRMDRVDTFLLHDPTLEAVSNDHVIQACEDLRKSGKANLTGVSSGDPAVLKAAIACGAFGVIQTPANLKVATALQPLWRECEANQIHVIGNHVFDPACLAVPGMTHEKLMRGSSALLPGNSTILCGSRNPSHLRQTLEWAHDPMDEAEAEHIATEFR